MITVYESWLKEYSRIMVTQNDVKVEEIDLDAFVYKNFEFNQVEINKVLTKYRRGGYTLISSVRGGIDKAPHFSECVMITTYLFEK